MTPKPLVVAIDGPSGSGKSTVARGVADALAADVLDTGAMYRAVTLAVIEAGAAIDDASACEKIARGVTVNVDGGRTVLDGRDVSAAIRGPDVTKAVSVVAAHPGVREVLVGRQREWMGAHGGGVVEGRDIGTVVFPDAPVKIFLTASEHERARRRQRDEEDAERAVAIDDVRSALERRDAIDTGRAVSPLRAAADAVVVDTTGVDIGTVVAEIVARARAVEAG